LAGTGTCCWNTRWSRASQTCSMGAMSGEFAGHGRTGKCSASRQFHANPQFHQLSGWLVSDHYGISRLASGGDVAICWYLQYLMMLCQVHKHTARHAQYNLWCSILNKNIKRNM
jgi:hypothetical protein